MHKFAYVNASSVDQAPSLLGKTWQEAQIIAGGTDLVGELKERTFTPKRVVNLKSIPGMSYIRQESGGLKIGALTTLADIESDETVRKQYGMLQQAVSTIASPQIRNVATIGGNICQRPRCWYYRGEDFDCLKKGGDRCYAVRGVNRYHAIIGGGPCYIVHPSDSATALTALNARVKIVGSTGAREVAMDNFFILPEANVARENILRPDEIVSEIIVPAPKPNTKSLFLKVRERDSIDFAMASVAVVVTASGGVCQEASIVMGGVAPIPWRVPDVERLLKGKRITAALAAQAAEMALQDADSMTDNEYKIQIAQNLVKNAVAAMA